MIEEELFNSLIDLKSEDYYKGNERKANRFERMLSLYKTWAEKVAIYFEIKIEQKKAREIALSKIDSKYRSQRKIIKQGLTNLKKQSTIKKVHDELNRLRERLEL